VPPFVHRWEIVAPVEFHSEEGQYTLIAGTGVLFEVVEQLYVNQLRWINGVETA
jgi:hypothetical protein